MDATHLDHLLAASARGNHKAFEEVVLDTHDAIRAVVVAWAPTLDLADEIQQESYVRAFQSLSNYEAQGQGLAWLKGIARNVAKEHIRAHKRQHQQVRGQLDQLIDQTDQSLLDELGGQDQHWRETSLIDCLSKLRSVHMKMLERRYQRSWSLGKIAKAFKRKKPAIASQLHRIRSTLKRCLESQELSRES